MVLFIDIFSLVDMNLALIERAQFAHNECVYQPGVYEYRDGFKGSFLEHLLREMESVHGKDLGILRWTLFVTQRLDLGTFCMWRAVSP
jgi:hypothetical protein